MSTTRTTSVIVGQYRSLTVADLQVRHWRDVDVPRRRGRLPHTDRRGSALLVVLWLSAALSAIAFSVASTVRSETGRVTSSVDRLKAYYLATGAIERARLYIEWGESQRNPDGTPRYYAPGMPRLEFQFPSGQAEVEVIPETAKMNINSSPPEDLYNLLLVLGAAPERAREITAGILDWRTPQPLGEPTMFDQLYLSHNPSFRSRHASFEEIEELLLIQGMTPELFYGTYGHDAEGRLTPHRALKDCVSVYGGTSGVRRQHRGSGSAHGHRSRSGVGGRPRPCP